MSRSNTHPDLQLWQQPWKHLERSRACFDSYYGSDAAPSPATPDEDMSRGEILMSNALEKLSRAATIATSSSSSSSASSPFPSFQDSYITSEHCYQKPRAYYPAVEQRLVVETRQGSELEDSMRSTEELLEREQRYGSLLETEKNKSAGATNKVGHQCDHHKSMWFIHLMCLISILYEDCRLPFQVVMINHRCMCLILVYC